MLRTNNFYINQQFLPVIVDDYRCGLIFSLNISCSKFFIESVGFLQICRRKFRSFFLRWCLVQFIFLYAVFVAKARSLFFLCVQTVLTLFQSDGRRQSIFSTAGTNETLNLQAHGFYASISFLNILSMGANNRQGHYTFLVFSFTIDVHSDGEAAKSKFIIVSSGFEGVCSVAVPNRTSFCLLFSKLFTATFELIVA